MKENITRGISEFLEYEPKIETIKGIRLIEHLNYAILLRIMGYDDSEIRNLLEQCLQR